MNIKTRVRLLISRFIGRGMKDNKVLERKIESVQIVSFDVFDTLIFRDEISHAFDTVGAQYDKDGNYVDWWTEDDHKAFEKRADKLIEYYNCISAWEGAKVQGNNVQTEAIADMAGMKAIALSQNQCNAAAV